MSEWQPIETAPKETIILLFAVTDRREDGSIVNWKMATGWSTPASSGVRPTFSATTDWAQWTWDGHRLGWWDHKPTHWMPLPDPPK